MTSITTPTLGEMVVNQLENTLFVAYGRKKDVFISSLDAPPKDDFETYTKPYISSAQDKAEETNLYSIISRAPRKSLDFSPISADYFEARFRLEPPKKVIHHVPSAPSMPSLLSGKPLPNRPSAASLPLSSSQNNLVGGMNRPTATSRNRATDIAAAVPIASFRSTVGPSASSANLYNVIESIFNRYWLMECDDPATNNAFFATIHAGNAHEFYLSAFAAQSTSLTVINTRIQNRQYSNIEAFKFDMETMFGNILRYYTEGSPPHVTAQQLFRQFQGQWLADISGIR